MMSEDEKNPETGAEDATAAGAAEETTEPEDQAEATQDQAADPAAHPADDAVDDPLDALQAENAQLKDRLMRALAEVENTRRRAEKDRQDAAKYGPSGLAKELLPVLDNLGRAVQSVTPDQREENEALNNISTGVEMVAKQFLDAFARFGVKQIDPEAGERFSYEVHQAMSELEMPDQPAGAIVQTLQPGYMMHDRLLRAAMVVVAKGGPKPGAAPPEDHKPIDTTA
ncbi:MAG: nucleotide exchange factor GrpE [Alphaproteobacteria bacterium]|nr:nucleotide exchange factor GrpE [Alphaproteobacteria bacterium]